MPVITTPPPDTQSPQDAGAFDYIIVGSGAGGAPLAARLAAQFALRARPGEKPPTILLLEAGPQQYECPETTPRPEGSEAPALHGPSTEPPALSWRFFVKHFEGNAPQAPKMPPQDPKWYPGDEDR